MDILVDALILNLMVVESLSVHTQQTLRLLDSDDSIVPRITTDNRILFKSIRRTLSSDGRIPLTKAIRKNLSIVRDLLPLDLRLRKYVETHAGQLEQGLHAFSRLYEHDLDIELSMTLLQAQAKQLLDPLYGTSKQLSLH